jgi:hypothetical protein
MIRPFKIWYATYLLVLVFAFSLIEIKPASGQEFCSEGSGDEGGCTGTCFCVGQCDCTFVFYREVCDAGTDCIAIRRIISDGGEGNCEFICCELWEWDCQTV